MVNETNYSKSVMKQMMSLLPNGSMQEISEKLGLSYNVVANACYGKYYNKAVVDEVESRFKAAKKALATSK